jgi:hypothetical protein
MNRMAAAAALVAVAALAIGVDYSAAHHNDHVATCHVTGKDRTSKSDGSSDMRIYTSDCDTLADSDSTWYGKHNSSNLYGQIQPGHAYRFRIAGYRSGLTSTFPNIIAIEPAPPGAR